MLPQVDLIFVGQLLYYSDDSDHSDVIPALREGVGGMQSWVLHIALTLPSAELEGGREV